MMSVRPRREQTDPGSHAAILFLAVIIPWVLFLWVQARTLPLDGLAPVWSPLLEGWPNRTNASPLLHAASLILLAIAAAAAITPWSRRFRMLRIRPVIVFALGGCLWTLNLFLPPYLSNDLFLYRALGVMQNAGANPYVVAPSAALSPIDIANVPFANQVAAYGPLALLIFRGATIFTSLTTQLHLLKILLVLPVVAAAVVIAMRCSSAHRPAMLAYLLLSPLLALELAGAGHLEGWIAALLVLTIVSLEQRTPLRIVLAGVLLGLAAAVKLPTLVCAGPCLGFLARRQDMPNRRANLILGTIFLAVALATTAIFYAPFRNSPEVLNGLFEQGSMVRRSLHFLVLQATGSRDLASGLGVSGLAIAAVVGFLACRGTRSLASGMALTVGLQAVLGRTFFQPWHLCPVVILTGWALAHDLKRSSSASAPGALRPVGYLLVTVWSASALIGGYVPYILIAKPGVATEYVSIALVFAPPLAVTATALVRHRSAILRR